MYDKTEEFEQQIAPTIQKLKAECFQNGVPLFLSCAVKDTQSTTEYISEMVSPAQLGVDLADDRIAEMVKMLNGFVAVPEAKPLELEFEVEQQLHTSEE